MIIFDGYKRASQIEQVLQDQMASLTRVPHVVSIYFQEDKGSVLYSRLKKEAASRLGFTFEIKSMSLLDPVDKIISEVKRVNDDPQVTGVMIQKPMRRIYEQALMLDGDQNDIKKAYQIWWEMLVGSIDKNKDVDGLTGKGKVVPATGRAVIEILENGNRSALKKKIAIIGKSDLLGIPLYKKFQEEGRDVTLLGSKELTRLVEIGKGLKEFDIIISATGRPGLIKGDMIKDGVVLIDVGEPGGDVDRKSVGEKPSFLTPVPGGVGPMTVICLMHNAIDMIK